MPIDPSIPLRALEGMYNPAQTVQTMYSLRDMMQQGQMRQQQFDMQRQEFDLKRGGLEREQKRQATLADLAPKAARGDRASIDALAGVDTDMFMKMDDRQRSQAKERAGVFAAVGQQLRSVPYEQRRAALTQMAPALQEAGISPEQLQAFDPSDQAIDGVVAQSLGIKGVLDKIDGDRKFGLDQSKFGYQQKNDAANRSVTVRGQDMSRGNALISAQASRLPKPPSISDQVRLAKWQAEQTEKGQARAGATASFDTAIGTLTRLGSHPGLEAAVGFKGVSGGLLGGWVPSGTEAANFNAELEAFKSQMFLPMVQQLKGMGALSNAEGQKLTAAVGALDQSMSEAEFKASATRIMQDLEGAKARAAGFNRSNNGPARGGGSKPVNAQDRLKAKYGLE